MEKPTIAERLEARKARVARQKVLRATALRLRKSGKTVQEVGDDLGVSKQRASILIQEAEAERAPAQ